MRWPFVYRGEYDALRIDRDNWHAFYDAAHEYIQQLSATYADLLDKYHALRVQGASITEAPKPVVPVDPVSAAITQAARHDPRLRALMAKEASRMREAQFTDHEIIEAIQNGVTSLEGLPA